VCAFRISLAIFAAALTVCISEERKPDASCNDFEEYESPA
jgi:hypothetical protein